MGWLESIIEVGPYIDLAGGALFVALGIWVATLQPRTPATVAFSLFAVTMGSYFIVSNLHNAGSDIASWTGYGRLLSTIALVCFLVVGSLGAFFPVKARGKEVRVVVLASVAGVLLCLPPLVYVAERAWAHYPNSETTLGRGAYVFSNLTGYHAILLGAAYSILLIAWAWRYPLLDQLKERRWRRQVQTVSFALVLYHSLLAGYQLGSLSHSPTFESSDISGLEAVWERVPLWGLNALVALAVAMKWLHNATLSRGIDRRRCIAIAWTGLGLMPLIFVGFIALGPDVSNTGIMGTARGVGVLMIVYSLLRYRLFEIEATAKFAVRGSTLAGLFAGLVFVGAEVLETLFNVSSALGSVLMAAAIALALRPLLRLAQRAADRVVPDTDAPTYAETHAKEMLEDQYAMAMRDGVMTKEELEVLDALAQRLGVRRPARKVEPAS